MRNRSVFSGGERQGMRIDDRGHDSSKASIFWYGERGGELVTLVN